MQENWKVGLSSFKVYRIPWANHENNTRINQYIYRNTEIKLPLESFSHLWLFDLKKFDYRPLFYSLSNDEKQKLNRIIPKKEQELRAKSRIILRIVLAKYLITTPDTLCFQYNKYGKPELKDNFNDVSFNLSHSANYLALLIGLKNDIGIDIESEVRSSEINLKLSKRFFFTEEYQKLKNLKEPKQSYYFNRLWTLKEAILKSAGLGIFLINKTPNFSFINMAKNTSDLIYYKTEGHVGFSLHIDGKWISTAKQI
jgi:4'-phosphopantetheinyl transferase